MVLEGGKVLEGAVDGGGVSLDLGEGGSAGVGGEVGWREGDGSQSEVELVWGEGEEMGGKGQRWCR